MRKFHRNTLEENKLEPLRIGHERNERVSGLDFVELRHDLVVVTGAATVLVSYTEGTSYFQRVSGGRQIEAVTRILRKEAADRRMLWREIQDIDGTSALFDKLALVEIVARVPAMHPLDALKVDASQFHSFCRRIIQRTNPPKALRGTYAPGLGRMMWTKVESGPEPALRS
jgi:hypothetical protein